MRNDLFLKELEERLNENRQIIEQSRLPSFLYTPASYLGLHMFWVLFLLSLGMTVVGFKFHYEGLMLLSKRIFWF